MKDLMVNFFDIIFLRQITDSFFWKKVDITSIISTKLNSSRTTMISRLIILIWDDFLWSKRSFSKSDKSDYGDSKKYINIKVSLDGYLKYFPDIPDPYL